MRTIPLGKNPRRDPWSVPFKICIAALAMAAALQAQASTGNNFTLLDAGGGMVGGTNDVTVTWDGTFNADVTDTNFNMEISSPTTFFGFNWNAHHVRVFGPGTYTFDTGCDVSLIEAGSCTPGAGGGTLLTMTVEPGQVGAHMLFDWGGNNNIDVVNVWDAASLFGTGTEMYAGGTTTEDPHSGDPAHRWGLANTDNDQDGVLGTAMVDGPFAGFSASFNAQLDVASMGNNFTLLDPGGGMVGGTNDVTVTWDGTFNADVTDTNFNMEISSPTTFFGFNWNAHHVRVFGPGTYTFDTGCDVSLIEAGSCTPGAGGGTLLTMTVEPGQVGAHMLFDWGGNNNIDVVNVWDVASLFGTGTEMYSGGTITEDPYSGDPAHRWGLSNTDNDQDGVLGTAMVDGPFAGFSASFNVHTSIGGDAGQVGDVDPITNILTRLSALIAGSPFLFETAINDPEMMFEIMKQMLADPQALIEQFGSAEAFAAFIEQVLNEPELLAEVLKKQPGNVQWLLEAMYGAFEDLAGDPDLWQSLVDALQIESDLCLINGAVCVEETVETVGTLLTKSVGKLFGR